MVSSFLSTFYTRPAYFFSLSLFASFEILGKVLTNWPSAYTKSLDHCLPSLPSVPFSLSNRFLFLVVVVVVADFHFYWSGNHYCATLDNDPTVLVGIRQ